MFNTGLILKTNTLAIETEDRLVLIPLHNVRSIEVTPPPADLPRYAVRNARVLS